MAGSGFDDVGGQSPEAASAGGARGEMRPRSMAVVAALGALVLVSPLLWARSAWFAVWALLIVLPYVVVAVRVLRRPLDRPGPALALGLCVVMIPVAVLLILVQWGRHEPLPYLFAAGLLAIHVLLLRLAVEQYRRGASSKPHWRLLLRGLIDPLVYYSVLFFLAAGANIHLD